MLTALVLICSAAVANSDCSYGNSDDVKPVPMPVVEYQGREIPMPSSNPMTVFMFASEWAAQEIAKGHIVLKDGQHLVVKVYKASDNPGEHRA